MKKIIARVTDIGYTTEDNETIVQLIARGEDRNRYVVNVTGTHPYFYVPEDKSVSGYEEVKRVEEGYESYENVPLQKVVTYTPKGVKNIRDDFDNPHEDDVVYERRVSVDEGLSGYIEIPKHKSQCSIDEIDTEIEVQEGDEIQPKIMMCDIETEVLGGSVDWDTYVDDTPGRVLMITTYDSYSGDYLCIALDEAEKIDPSDIRGHLEEHWGEHDDAEDYTECEIRFRRCDTESQVLEAFLSEVERTRPDLFSAWNVSFDWNYLINRMDNTDGLDSSVSIHRLSDVDYVMPWKDEQAALGLPAFDLQDSFVEDMSYGEWRSKSLEYVSSEELGVSKVEGDSIMKEYNNRRSKFASYNIVDVQLMVGIDKKNSVHDFFYALADLCGVNILDTQ